MRRAPEWWQTRTPASPATSSTSSSTRATRTTHKGDKDVALEYASSEAKVYAMRLQTLTGEATYLRCKGCPCHAAKKDVFFQHVKAAAEKKTVHSVTFNALRMKSACAEHVRLKKVVMRGNNNKVLSIEG